MSTTTWQPPCSDGFQDRELLRREPSASLQRGLAEIVSQKMLAVSASVIGVCALRWRARGQVQVVVAVAKLVRQRRYAEEGRLEVRQDARLVPAQRPMQKAPSRLPARGSASIQCSRKARSAKSRILGE